MSAVYVITEEQLRELAEIREQLGRILANAVVVVEPSYLANREQLHLNGSHAPMAKDPCPRCGHMHEGVQECGVEIAKDRVCHCEREAASR